MNVNVGPGDGAGDGGGGVAVGSGSGLGAGAVVVSVAVTVLVTVPVAGRVVTAAVAGVLAAGSAVNDGTDPGETAGGGGAVLAGTLAAGGCVLAVVRAAVNAGYRGNAVRADAVPAAGLNTVGCGAGAGLGVMSSARPAIVVICPVSAMVIVAAMMTAAQHASSTYQASWYQGMSRRTIRGSLPSRRQPFLFAYELVDYGQQPS